MRQDIPFSDAELRALAKRLQAGQEPPDTVDLLTDQEFTRLQAMLPPEPKAAAPDVSRLNMLDLPRQFAQGLVQSVPKAIVGAGQLVHKIPGVSQAVDALYGGGMDSQSLMDEAAQAPELQPTTPAMRGGQLAGEGAQFLLGPSGKITAAQAAPRVVRGALDMGRQAAAGGLLSAVQGNDPAMGAGMGAAGVPVAGAIGAVARATKNAAVPLVRSGVKPLWSDMSKQAGASTIGQEKMANRLARFILDEGITDATKAEAIIRGAERDIQGLVGGQPTDAPARAQRYLLKLAQSASRQGLPESDVSTIVKAADELLNGPHGMTTTITKPGPMVSTGILDPQGKAVMRQGPDVTEAARVRRPSMPADEALEVARGSGKWGNRKSWGEQKGAATEASKAVERADRDAIKEAVPGSRPHFRRQGQAIQARKVFTRGEYRQANRDTIGMPTIMAGAAEVSNGRVPIMAMAAEFMRRNQVKMGVWADRLGTALQNNDVETVGAILRRFGVGLGQSLD